MKLFVILSLFFCTQAFSDDEIPQFFYKTPDIDKITNSINFGSSTLMQRLDEFNIKPTVASIRHITKEDAADDTRVKIGDIEYSVDFNPDNVTNLCKVLGTADFIMRKHKIIPETKTAIWLMTGKCETPE